MTPAFINGKPANLADATQAAGRLLESARFILVAGLGADINGARAAILLAERLRGAFDHMFSRAMFNTLDVLREAGMMLTTPNEVRVRADTLLMVGPNVEIGWPQIWERLALHQAPVLGVQTPRRVIWLGAPRGAHIPATDCTAIAAEPGKLPGILAALRARLAARNIAVAPLLSAQLDEIANHLKAAQFGAAIWLQDDLDALATEMLCGIVLDLNQTIRFSGLPIAPGCNASGVAQAAGWMTGYPMRTSFGRGYPDHDSLRFDSKRLVASGEVDAVLWVNAMDASAPNWNVPMVAMTQAGVNFARPPAVQIIVGQPGVDHAGVLHDAATGLMLAAPATAPGSLPAIAAVISQIAAAMSDRVPLPC